MMKILFIGPPGAGKGTQAKMLGLEHISTGEVIREAFKSEDPIISPYKEYIERGGFLPDELIFELVESRIEKLGKQSKGYVLDGAVRTIAQAEFILKKSLINLIIDFQMSEEELKKRLSLRKEKENRKDDSPEAVEKRFEEYKQKTYPISEYFRTNCPSCYFVIDAAPSIEEVNKEISKIIKKFDFN